MESLMSKFKLEASHVLDMEEAAVKALAVKLEPILEEKVKLIMLDLVQAMQAQVDSQLVALPKDETYKKLELEASKGMLEVVKLTLLP